MSSDDAARALADALESLAVEVEALTYPTPSDAQLRRAARRDRTAWIVREHLIRRLADLDGALRVAVVGPTGSGASPLLNSLAGLTISPAGPLRPTTTVPVVWCHPSLEPEFAFDFLSGFGTGADATRPLRVVAHRHPLVESLALVDVPDFDSTEVEHREIAELLVDASDLCLLVVSRHRYADGAVWEFLDHVGGRPVKLAAVMNRTERGDGPAVIEFDKRLQAAGFDNALVAVVEEQPLEQGMLTNDALDPVRTWLQGLGEPAARRKRVMDGISSTLGTLFRHLDALDNDRGADLAEGQALCVAAGEVASEHGVLVVERMPTVSTRADLAALIERELGEVRRRTVAAWGGLAGGRALGAALADLEIPDVAAAVAIKVTGSGDGDELAAAVRNVFDEAGRAAQALVPEPRSIGGLERAAAGVMQAGRRFLDA